MERVEIEHLRLGDSAFNRDCPGERAKGFRVMRGVALRSFKLVTSWAKQTEPSTVNKNNVNSFSFRYIHLLFC